MVLSTNAYFYLYSFVLISFFSVLSILYPMFSFIFMVFVTCILTSLTLPYNISDNFSKIQNKYFIKLLTILNNALILDYLSVIFIKFFCVPTKIYYRRLLCIFCINLLYIFCSRSVFIKVVFWGEELTGMSAYIIYIILFTGISIIYLRLLLNLSLFFVYSALRIAPHTLLSPSVLYVLGYNDDVDLPKTSEKNSIDKKFSLINVTTTRNYYRQYFSQTQTGNFKFLSYSLAICGAFAAYGTFWYTRTQAQASIIQAEQAKQQTYHTAREADVAAYEAKLITQDEYYKRHPEDKPKSP